MRWIGLDSLRYPTVSVRWQQQSTVTTVSQRKRNVIKESDNEKETQESVEKRVHGLFRSDLTASLLGDLFNVSTSLFRNVWAALCLSLLNSETSFTFHLHSAGAICYHPSLLIEWSLFPTSLISLKYLFQLTDLLNLLWKQVFQWDCSSSLKYLDSNDFASLSLYKFPCKRVMSNPERDFDAWLAGLLSGYQYFTIKLSVWQQVKQQTTRVKSAAGRVKRHFTLSRSGVWWSVADGLGGSQNTSQKFSRYTFPTCSQNRQRFPTGHRVLCGGWLSRQDHLQSTF